MHIRTSDVSKSSIAAVNANISPFSVSVAIVVTGAVTYNLEYTYDDIFAAGFSEASATWFNHPTLAAGQTTTKDATFSAPVTGIRVNQTAGAGSTISHVIQAGI